MAAKLNAPIEREHCSAPGSVILYKQWADTASQLNFIHHSPMDIVITNIYCTQ